MNDFGHILSKHGVLVAFNIAKKVKQTEINKIRNKLKETCDTEEEINEQLEKLIVLQIKNTLNNQEIPGIIKKNQIDSQHNPLSQLPDKLKQKVMQMVMYFSQIASSEKFNKELIMLVAQMFLSQNKITQKDIIAFNKKYKLKSFGEENYLDNDEEDENEDDDQP
jgi:hypothetical protein